MPDAQGHAAVSTLDSNDMATAHLSADLWPCSADVSSAHGINVMHDVISDSSVRSLNDMTDHTCCRCFVQVGVVSIALQLELQTAS